MSVYTPDRWQIVEISDDNITIQKVFAGWYGGYLGSDCWKLSSGITDCVEFDDRYEFTNHSGSLYICYKQSQGTTGYMAQIYYNWAEQYGNSIKIIDWK
jgi:hypothetical protein